MSKFNPEQENSKKAAERIKEIEEKIREQKLAQLRESEEKQKKAAANRDAKQNKPATKNNSINQAKNQPTETNSSDSDNLSNPSQETEIDGFLGNFSEISSQLSDKTEELFPSNPQEKSDALTRNNSLSSDLTATTTDENPELAAEQDKKDPENKVTANAVTENEVTKKAVIDTNQSLAELVTNFIADKLPKNAELTDEQVAQFLADNAENPEFQEELKKAIEKNPEAQKQAQEIIDNADEIAQEIIDPKEDETRAIESIDEAISLDKNSQNQNTDENAKQNKESVLTKLTKMFSSKSKKTTEGADEENEGKNEGDQILNNQLKQNEQLSQEILSQQEKEKIEEQIKSRRLTDQISPKDMAIGGGAIVVSAVLIAMVPGIGPLAAIAVLASAGYMINNGSEKNTEIDRLKAELESFKEGKENPQNKAKKAKSDVLKTEQASEKFVEEGKRELDESQENLAEFLPDSNDNEQLKKEQNEPDNQPAENQNLADENPQLVNPALNPNQNPLPTNPENDPLIEEIVDPEEIEKNRKIKEEQNKPEELDEDDKNKKKAASIEAHQENLTADKVNEANEIAKKTAQELVNKLFESKGLASANSLPDNDATSIPDVVDPNKSREQ